MKFTGTDTYITDDYLTSIVNAAITLEKPLLIRGEPGTGKTLLAHAIAESLNLELFTWHVKSTSKAQEGLYTYDAVKRLNDSRFSQDDISDVSRYIELGPLGTAFKKQTRSVVLIDEIDKADIEFPNDLLHELDAMSFSIFETGETVQACQRPIVIITSNAEKELPDAFLRRCVFHYIEFPNESQMKKIAKVHHPDLEEKILSLLLARFYWLRDLPEIRKPPSTSELIDWISVLIRGGFDYKRLKQELPFLGVLFKKESDLASLQRHL